MSFSVIWHKFLHDRRLPRLLEGQKAPHHPPWVMESINPGSRVLQERVRRSSLWCELRTVNAVSKIVGRPAQKMDCVYLKETVRRRRRRRKKLGIGGLWQATGGTLAGGRGDFGRSVDGTLAGRRSHLPWPEA